MGKEWYEEREFLDLRDEWYAKLKAEGHQDIEIVDRITRQHGPLMHGPSMGDLRRGLYKPETEEYYASCRKHLWRIKARPAVTHSRVRVWELYSEGYSAKRIATTTGYSQGYVNKVLKYEIKNMREQWDAMHDAEAED